MAEFDTVRSVGVGARAQIDEGLRAHMNKVYGLMSVAMLVTAGVAWSVGTSDALLAIFRDPLTLRPNILGWVVMFAPLAMVFAFGALLNRMSAAAAQVFFYAFAAVMGLIGHVIAMVVNIFLASSALAFAISVIGVLIFAGLTA